MQQFIGVDTPVILICVDTNILQAKVFFFVVLDKRHPLHIFASPLKIHFYFSSKKLQWAGVVSKAITSFLRFPLTPKKEYGFNLSELVMGKNKKNNLL